MRGRREQRNPAILSISRQYEAGTHVREKPQHHATHFLCGIAASAAADLYRRKFRLGRMSLPPLRGRGTNRVTDIATLSSGLLHVHTVARSACAVCTQCLSSSNGARPASNGLAEKQNKSYWQTLSVKFYKGFWQTNLLSVRRVAANSSLILLTFSRYRLANRPNF